MILFRLAAAVAGLGALYAAGLTARHDLAQPIATAPYAIAAIPARAAAGEQRHSVVPSAPAAVKTAAAPVTTPTPERLARAEIDDTPTGALEPLAAPLAAPVVGLPSELVAQPPPDASRLVAAAALYRKGDVAGGDAVAKDVSDPIERTAIEWSALRLVARPDDRRLAAFGQAHPRWPGGDWIRAVAEAHLYTERPAPQVVAATFAAEPPRTPAGQLAVARAALDAGKREEAYSTIRALWRDGDFDVWTENAILKDFAAALAPADHKYRADRLLYAERAGAAMRAAALAGADEVALAQARIAAMTGPLPPRALAAMPAALQSDPGLIFAHVQDARRGNRALEAADWLARAPKAASLLIDRDKWWSEQRMVARELLDLGQIQKAYDICAAAAPASIPARIDAEFHTGWIALRFANDPARAAPSFAKAAEIAQTPLSIARAAYWQGRAAEALGRADEARGFYERAANWPIAYYGQLAAKRLGRAAIVLRAPSDVAAGDARDEATRVVALLYAAGLEDLATPLAEAAAGRWSEAAQVAALAAVVAEHADPRTNVEFGKIVTERGFPLDGAAFPTSGVPSFAPLPHSADLPSVYAIARQESEFATRALSGAGARGLMQILPATAQGAARRAGVAFDPARLNADPAFNTQLGAAYLGQLLDDEGGSLELALASYNAGQGRVAQWLAAYGDPRTGKADLVDWVERIPFDETRDYVERVSENLGVYRALLTDAPAPQAPRMARASD